MAQWTSLQWINKFINPAPLYLSCEKSGVLYIVESGLMAGRLADWQTKFRSPKILKLTVNRNTYFICALFSQGTALC